MMSNSNTNEEPFADETTTRTARASRLVCFIVPAIAIIWRNNWYLDVNPNPQDLTPAIMCALTVLFLLLSGFVWCRRID